MLANPVVFIFLAFGFIVCTGLLLTFLNDTITARLEQRKAHKRHLKRRPPSVTYPPTPCTSTPSPKTEEPFKVITVKTRCDEEVVSDLPKAA